MKKLKYILLLLIMVVVTFSSCEKEEEATTITYHIVYRMVPGQYVQAHLYTGTLPLIMVNCNIPGTFLYSYHLTEEQVATVNDNGSYIDCIEQSYIGMNRIHMTRFYLVVDGEEIYDIE